MAQFRGERETLGTTVVQGSSSNDTPLTVKSADGVERFKVADDGTITPSVGTSLGYTPENVANKDTDVTLAANSDTKYPSQKAIKAYVLANTLSASAPANAAAAGTAGALAYDSGFIYVCTATNTWKRVAIATW